jgi:hypothetical protein
MEDDGLRVLGAPVLVVDVRIVAHRNHWHQMFSFGVLSRHASSLPSCPATYRLWRPRRLV